MKYAKKNKGVIVFYLLLMITTFVIINVNERKLSIENKYVYLAR